jgi:hypothetical protein
MTLPGLPLTICDLHLAIGKHHASPFPIPHSPFTFVSHRVITQSF